MERLDTSVAIQTPERVAFRHQLAGPGLRGAAWLLDALVQLVIGLLVTVVFGLSATAVGEASVGLILLAAFVVWWLYGALFESLWGGRTPGKALLGLRVVQLDGSPVTPGACLLRNLLRGIDGLPVLYGVGGLVCLMDDRMRRLGDIVAGTMVVVSSSSGLGPPVVVEPPLQDEERANLPPRVVLTSDERRVIEALLRRARQLGPDRAEELAQSLAPTVQARTGVEADTALRTLTLAWARATGRDR